MAQTIQLYRGQVTCTQGSTTTLFTNTSSGTATRLRIGYIGWQSNFSTVYGALSIGILRSGSSNYVAIGASGGSNPARTESFVPHNTSITSGAGTSQTLPWLNNGSGVTLYQTNGLSQGNPPSSAFYIADVMIGPSDQVAVGWYDNGGGSRSAVVDYCMVAITEA